MKKLLVIAALSLFSLGAFAQLPFSLGVKVGLTSSKFTTDNLNKLYANDVEYDLEDFSEDAQNGFQVGLMSRIKLKKWFIQPELYYSFKKGKTTIDGYKANTDDVGATSVQVTQKVEMNNLDIPILLGYRLVDLKIFKLNLFTGPVASFQVKNAVNFTNELSAQAFQYKDTSTDKSIDPEEEMKNANWNWQAGLGIDIAMLYLDVRHEWGLNDITKADFEQKSNMLTFTLGWKFF